MNYMENTKSGVNRLQFSTGKRNRAQFATTQIHQPPNLCASKVK